MEADTLRTRSTGMGIVLVTACLLVIGLVMVASAQASIQPPKPDAKWYTAPLVRQAVFTVAGFGAILLVAHVGHRIFDWRPGKLSQPSILLLLLAILCLAAVFVPGLGVERNGARRWLQIGRGAVNLGFQPSELAKLALVTFMAAFLGSRGLRVRSFWKTTLPAALVLGMFVALVGKEDFGTAALLACVGFAMMVVGGVCLWHLILPGIPAIAALTWLVKSEPYRLQRVTTFLDIWKDPRGSGYHPVQSLVTIARGGWFGRGLGAGIQKYDYLPEAHTDFIFAVICEEVGAIGGAVIVALFAILLILGARAMWNATRGYTRLIAFGVTTTVVVQAVINIAVVTVCAPTKGISLPLVSAGGSGVLILGTSLGLLVSAAREADEDKLGRLQAADNLDRGLASSGGYPVSRTANAV